MSATTSTAGTGQSSQVGPLVGAAVLAGIVAFGAFGLAISQGVGHSTVARPAAGPAVGTTSMSGPRSAAQKGLGVDQAAIAARKDADASVTIGANKAAIAARKDADASVTGATFNEADLAARMLAAQATAAYSGTAFEGKYRQWLSANGLVDNEAALAARLMAAQTGATYSGSDFAGQYGQWLATQDAKHNEAEFAARMLAAQKAIGNGLTVNRISPHLNNPE